MASLGSGFDVPIAVAGCNVAVTDAQFLELASPYGHAANPGRFCRACMLRWSSLDAWPKPADAQPTRDIVVP